MKWYCPRCRTFADREPKVTTSGVQYNRCNCRHGSISYTAKPFEKAYPCTAAYNGELYKCLPIGPTTYGKVLVMWEHDPTFRSWVEVLHMIPGEKNYSHRNSQNHIYHEGDFVNSGGMSYNIEHVLFGHIYLLQKSGGKNDEPIKKRKSEFNRHHNGRSKQKCFDRITYMINEVKYQGKIVEKLQTQRHRKVNQAYGALEKLQYEMYLVQPTHIDGSYQKDMDLMVVKEEQLKYAPDITPLAIGPRSNYIGGSRFESHDVFDFKRKLNSEEKGTLESITKKLRESKQFTIVKDGKEENGSINKYSSNLMYCLDQGVKKWGETDPTFAMRTKSVDWINEELLKNVDKYKKTTFTTMDLKKYATKGRNFHSRNDWLDCLVFCNACNCTISVWKWSKNEFGQNVLNKYKFIEPKKDIGEIYTPNSASGLIGNFKDVNPPPAEDDIISKNAVTTEENDENKLKTLDLLFIGHANYSNSESASLFIYAYNDGNFEDEKSEPDHTVETGLVGQDKKQGSDNETCSFSAVECHPLAAEYGTLDSHKDNELKRTFSNQTRVIVKSAEILMTNPSGLAGTIVDFNKTSGLYSIDLDHKFPLSQTECKQHELRLETIENMHKSIDNDYFNQPEEGDYRRLQQILITDPNGLSVYKIPSLISVEMYKKAVHEVLAVRPPVLKFHQLKRIRFYKLAQEEGWICDYHPNGKKVFEILSNFDDDGQNVDDDEESGLNLGFINRFHAAGISRNIAKKLINLDINDLKSLSNLDRDTFEQILEILQATDIQRQEIRKAREKYKEQNDHHMDWEDPNRGGVELKERYRDRQVDDDYKADGEDSADSDQEKLIYSQLKQHDSNTPNASTEPPVIEHFVDVPIENNDLSDDDHTSPSAVVTTTTTSSTTITTTTTSSTTKIEEASSSSSYTFSQLKTSSLNLNAFENTLDPFDSRPIKHQSMDLVEEEIPIIKEKYFTEVDDGQSVCNSCYKNIEQGEYRIGVKESSSHEAKTIWHHNKCWNSLHGMRTKHSIFSTSSSSDMMKQKSSAASDNLSSSSRIKNNVTLMTTEEEEKEQKKFVAKEVMEDIDLELNDVKIEYFDDDER